MTEQEPAVPEKKPDPPVAEEQPTPPATAPDKPAPPIDEPRAGPVKYREVQPETPSAPSKTPAGAPESKGGFRMIIEGFSKVLRVIAAPFLWVLRPLVFSISTEPGSPKVRFTSFSTLMYLWPIMVVGWVNYWISGWEWVTVSPELLGWIWLTVVLIVAICIGADVDRNKMFVMAIILVVLWFGGILLKDKANFPILSHIHKYFADLNVQFEPGTALVFSVAILILLIGVVFTAWFDGRYEISTREITHRRILRTSDSLPRAAKRIKRDWRDLAEFFLGIGAGDLIVIDTNKNIVLRIANVPFLWFFRHEVDHVLEVLAVTDIDEIAAAEEEEAG